MSIIADTLQRLQTQTNGEGPDTPDSQAIVIPTRGNREPGWHNRPSRLKFWLVGLGMTIGLSGLGLVAYWIGFNLDFGLSTYASPRSGQGMALSDSSSILETSPFDSSSSESMQMPVAGPVRDVPSSITLHPEEESSTIQNNISPAILNLSNTDNPLPSSIPGTVPVSSEIKVGSIHTIRPQTYQTAVSTNVSTPNNAIELSANKKSAEPKPASPGFHTPTPARSDKPAYPLIEAEVFDVTEPPLPIELAFQKEGIDKEEFSHTSHLSIAGTPLLSNTTLTIPHQKTSHQNAQTRVSSQRSPTHWLQQAQQLIQAEKYEEAHAVLDPLFKDPPVNWEPWFWMGTALLGQSHLEQADQFFLSGLARNDKIPQLWIQRALVAHQRGEYQLAIHELRRAESLDATLPHVHLNMGYAYEKLGNERLAHEYYVKFLKLSEGNPAFFSIRKKLYARFTEQVQSTPHPRLPSSLPENP